MTFGAAIQGYNNVHFNYIILTEANILQTPVYAYCTALLLFRCTASQNLGLFTPGPDLSVCRPWAGSLLEAPTHPQML